MMRLLMDTHLLLWLSGSPGKLSRNARRILGNPENKFYFSAISIWEIVIKSSLGRTDFQIDAAALRLELLSRGFSELPLTAEHALVVADLPRIHKDLFDRVLIAQARQEGLVFVTADQEAAAYPGQVIRV